MILRDKVDMVGDFTFRTRNASGHITDEYRDTNLIMDKARSNMAQLVAGVNDGAGSNGDPINAFVLGTMGHVGTNILENKQVGDLGFDSTREDMFSEEDIAGVNYRVTFDPAGGLDVSTDGSGQNFVGTTPGPIDGIVCPVRRVVSDRTVTYTISIPIENANPLEVGVQAIAYTEATLYTGDDIFSMKTFPARVKEDTVSFEIIWSIIF